MAPGNAKAAVSFDQIIQADRERRKNEALAKEIFGKGRRASAPNAAGLRGASGAGPSLASRVGVVKRASSTTVRPLPGKRSPKGNVNAEWTHDLHDSSSNNDAAQSQNQNRNSRAARLNAALSNPTSSNQFNIVQSKPRPAAPASSGLSIRGLAGPCAIRAQNFAHGTTAADIESALTPVGGKILDCKIVTQRPLIIAEIIFESREGAETVVETFDGQMADGKLLHLYIKSGTVNLPTSQSAPALNTTNNNNATTPTSSANAPPTGPRADRERDRARNADRNEGVVDGTYGFEEDRMDTDDNTNANDTSNNQVANERDNSRRDDRDRDRERDGNNSNRDGGRNNYGSGSGYRGGRGRGLYSDNIVNRRGDSYRGSRYR